MTWKKIKPKEKITNYIDYRRLISTYKIFKDSPERVFIKADFKPYLQGIATYVFILEKLGLIEVVEVIYKCGNGNGTFRTTAGYKYVKVKTKGYKFIKQEDKQEHYNIKMQLEKLREIVADGK